MPNGLPARFDDPDTGFARLCEFLEIANRTQQQSILNIEPVKRAVRSRKAAAQKLSTAKRVRMLLTAFYGLANERRELWRHTQNEPSDVPSLEYHALRGYDARFAERNLDEERVVQALAEFPGVMESIADAPEWQHPALTIWPDLLVGPPAANSPPSSLLSSRPFSRNRSPCQWQPKTAHFGEIHLGRSGRSPVDAHQTCWAGRRERSDRSPGQHAP